MTDRTRHTAPRFYEKHSAARQAARKHLQDYALLLKMIDEMEGRAA